jgi:UDP-N-acetylmuramate--alanine ligase
MESHSISQFAGRKVHFIGIDGCGMRGLAPIMVDLGATVTGSDPHLTLEAQRYFDRWGIRVSRDQRGELLTGAVDLVVRTAAIPDDNQEFRRACELGLAHVKYAQLLGRVMAERFGIAVAGTHGKTTTTSMIAYALTQAQADPTFVIGGSVRQLGGSSRSGRGPAFVVEACEYDRSFHNLRPRIAVVTNIEEEHLDCYPGGIDEIIPAFRKFARLVPEDGLIISHARDENARQALRNLRRPIEWVELVSAVGGTGSGRAARWQTRQLESPDGFCRGELLRDGRPVALLSLSVAGVHNLSNATMAVAACAAYGMDPAVAAGHINRFEGADRRMTELGRIEGAVVVDDYGHHPTEIRATLQALRQRYNPSRLVCVFQPHQGSRTRLLMDKFAAAFDLADVTIVPEIYYTRDTEEERRSTRAEDLVRRIVESGQDAVHIAELGQVVDYLKNSIRPGDLVLTIGAGNVWQVGRRLLDETSPGQ